MPFSAGCAVPGKREFAASVFGSLGLIRTVGALRSAAVRDLRVLAYHRVLPHLDENAYPYDLELVSATASEFEWQMAYLGRNFVPVTCREVADALHDRRPLPRRAAMVTFDDGFLDNYEVAFPILKRLGVPGVFFLATGYIGGRRTFWFDQLVHLLLRTAAPSIRIDALDITLAIPSGVDGRRVATMQMLKRLKTASETDRLRALEQLEAAADIPPDTKTGALSAPMTWAHVREMSRSGMEFGSHTVTHPILARMDREHMRMELEVSKADIERETGAPVQAMAYPVGGTNAVNSQVLEAAAQAGYRIAFTYQPGANRLASTAPLLLKRLPVERYTSRRMFEAVLQCPEVFADRGLTLE